MKSKNKKYNVTFSDEALKQIDSLPNDVYDKLAETLSGFKSGDLDPKKIGQPVDWIELDIKLICPECKSHNVEWLLDKNSGEVDFRCIDCSGSFWMTHKEYKEAVKNNPDKIINQH
ncbi:MAG: hypothetical protein ABH864_02365 [archaeon]